MGETEDLEGDNGGGGGVDKPVTTSFFPLPSCKYSLCTDWEAAFRMKHGVK